MIKKPEQRANEFCEEFHLEKDNKFAQGPVGLNYLFKSIVSFAVTFILQDLFIILTEYNGHEVPQNLVQFRALISLVALLLAVIYSLLAIATFVRALIKFVGEGK